MDRHTRKAGIYTGLEMVGYRRIGFVFLMAAGLLACAHETLQERVERETAESMLRTYAFDGYPPSFPEIAKRLRREAEMGDARAQSRLAELYFYGFGVPRDSAERAKWHRKAANGGNKLSQHFLAWIYLEGDGLEQDYRRALEWFGRSAAQGWPNARTQYDCLSPKEHRVSEDGRRESAPAADHSSLRSALPEWVESDFGFGIFSWRRPCDEKLNRWGLKSFFMAANAGSAKAQYLVGVAYLSGRGILPDRGRAAHWFLKAARQGHRSARREYCALYRAEQAPMNASVVPGGCRGVPRP